MNEHSPSKNEAAGLPPEVEAWLSSHPEVSPEGMEEAWRLALLAESAGSSATPDAARINALYARVREAIARSDAGAAPGLGSPPVDWTRERAASEDRREPEGRATHGVSGEDGALQDRVLQDHTSQEHAAREDRAPRPSRASRRRLTRIRFVAAATVATAVLVGIFFWLRPVTVEVRYGARQIATLPDGSTAELNSGSRLSYARSFGEEARVVRVRGEAFFDVVESQVPFVVETFNGSITVMGTRFNVRAWPEDPQPETVVVLDEGSVHFGARGARQEVVQLEPGQMSRVIAGSDQPESPVTVEIDQSLAWRAGGMTFPDRPIGAVLDELERRFDVRIACRPAELRSERVSLFLPRVEDAEEVLSTVAATRDLTYHRTRDGFVLERS